MEAATKEELIRGLDNNSFRQQSFSVNTDKNIVLSTLLNVDKAGNVDASHTSLAGLFAKHFKGLADKTFTLEDISYISRLLRNDGSFRINIADHNFNNIRKGSYINSKNKRSSFFYLAFENRACIMGASSLNKAVWFVFTNDKTDVNNGIIFTRSSTISNIKKFCTFEINPFVTQEVPVTDKETGITETKNILTFNPGWLSNTINNMDKQVFQK